MTSLINDTIAHVCNYQGKVVWMSHDDLHTKVGDYLWKQTRDDQVDSLKSTFARVATTGIPQTGEGITKTGELFRGWAWALGSPDYSVCTLFVEVPRRIADLSAKERELMKLIAVGRTVRQAAVELRNSISTVHTHLRRIREKLELDSLESVVAFAGRYLPPLPGPSTLPPSRKVEFEENSEATSEFSESIAKLAGTHAMICNWQGTIIWQSQSGIMAQVGDPVWKYARQDFSQQTRDAVARCITLGEPQRGEAFNQRGEYYRAYAWPLKSPEAAMFVLMVQLPKAIANLTDREREVVNLLGVGCPVKQIAIRLDVSATTVHSLLKAARESLGLENQTELISFAARHCHLYDLPHAAR